ncbi:helix-turn-helix domain-containing protein [Streptomyces sp. NPDC048723]|uniref:helix-turn-helix domain-containing protein n=1 Tax=Streptomyces sp. NPDC048723 TaxID=3365589 RepID=UPI0037248581
MTDRGLRGVGFPSVKRSFKYRFYPTDAQAVELSRTFGCVRKVYNLALAARAEACKAGGEARTRVARIHGCIADRRELRSMPEYGTAWYGRELIAVDRWFPSSTPCSACGVIADAMPLSIREWTGESCGTAHDRDGNAAVSLLAAGLAAAACGADVGPHRESSSRSGRSVAKQEPHS